MFELFNTYCVLCGATISMASDLHYEWHADNGETEALLEALKKKKDKDD